VAAQTLRITFEGIIGHEGVADGAFLHPFSVSVDPAGRLYVADTGNHRVQMFEENGAFIRQAGGFGLQAQQLNQPMSVDATGLDVYVADTQNRRIHRFDRALNYLGTLADRPEAGAFGFPRGMAVSALGDIYIVDSENEEVLRMGTAGRVETRFGGFSHGEGRLRQPAGIAVDRNGRVYVADTGHHRIAVYDAFGGFLREIGVQVLNAPEGVDVDDKGRLYVADTGHHRIAVFSGGGELLGVFGAEGSGPGSFRSPRDMAVAWGGLLYVADTGNHRVQKLKVEEATGEE
jgi:DNA-binding beta-propeller fold protein YncE